MNAAASILPFLSGRDAWVVVSPFPYLDHLYQAPVGFYTTRNAWDFAPGYERDVAPDFTRPITRECLFCHTTSAKLAPASVNRYTEITHGIQCERCHGDVTSHDKLVNPAKLAPRLRDSVCEQCHLAGQVRLAQPDRDLTTSFDQAGIWRSM